MALTALIVALLGCCLYFSDVTVTLSQASVRLFLIFSASIFTISFIVCRFRYRIAIKINRGIIDERVFISIKGVGKGARWDIPLASVSSCTACAYQAPLSDLIELILTSNALIHYSDGSCRVVSLPGHCGPGVKLEYESGVGLIEKKAKQLIVPSHHPEVICRVIRER